MREEICWSSIWNSFGKRVQWMTASFLPLFCVKNLRESLLKFCLNFVWQTHLVNDCLFLSLLKEAFKMLGWGSWVECIILIGRHFPKLLSIFRSLVTNTIHFGWYGVLSVSRREKWINKRMLLETLEGFVSNSFPFRNGQKSQKPLMEP